MSRSMWTIRTSRPTVPDCLDTRDRYCAQREAQCGVVTVGRIGTSDDASRWSEVKWGQIVRVRAREDVLRQVGIERERYSVLTT